MPLDAPLQHLDGSKDHRRVGVGQAGSHTLRDGPGLYRFSVHVFSDVLRVISIVLPKRTLYASAHTGIHMQRTMGHLISNKRKVIRDREVDTSAREKHNPSEKGLEEDNKKIRFGDHQANGGMQYYFIAWKDKTQHKDFMYTYTTKEIQCICRQTHTKI